MFLPEYINPNSCFTVSREPGGKWSVKNSIWAVCESVLDATLQIEVKCFSQVEGVIPLEKLDLKEVPIKNFPPPPPGNYHYLLLFIH